MRGLVRITETTVDGRRIYGAACTRCTWRYSNSVKTDVEQHKRWHLCPEAAS